MNPVIESSISCPYCGESFSVLLDLSQDSHQTVEDCYVCCRPINILVECEGEQLLRIECASDDEVLF
jgi:hypothetical protein